MKETRSSTVPGEADEVGVAPEAVWLRRELARRGLGVVFSAPGAKEPAEEEEPTEGETSARPTPRRDADDPPRASTSRVPQETAAERRDPLQIYLREVSTARMMTREQEEAAGKRIEEGERKIIEAASSSALARRESSEAAEQAAPVTLEQVEHLVARLAALYRRLVRARAANDDAMIAHIEAESGAGADELQRTYEVIQRGEREVAAAKADLIASHQPLVISYARRNANRGLPLLDLIQEGNLGLMNAANRFDYRLGFRFATYARWWVRQAMQRALMEHGRIIRLPVHRSESLGRLARARAHLAARLQREPTSAELAAELQVPVEQIDELMVWARRILYLEAPLGEGEEGVLADVIANPQAELPAAAAMASELETQARRHLATLTPREQQVLRMRFGMDDEHEHTLEEIGSRFGVTRERIRQIEAKALDKLRHPARARALRATVDLA